MKFTFEEAELINVLFEELPLPSPADALAIVKAAKNNAEDQEIVELAESVASKFSFLAPHTVTAILSDLPIDCYTEYN